MRFKLFENSEGSYEKIVLDTLSKLNNFLDNYGFEVELVSDYEFDNDCVGMFLNSMQDDASVFPIALNKFARDYCDNYLDDNELFAILNHYFSEEE